MKLRSVSIILLLLSAIFSAWPKSVDTAFSPAAKHCHFALVLSGGGARGLSQIGVLKALEEAQVKPDLIVGTSMGAIIGSLYAAGYSPDSIAQIARTVDWSNVVANAAARNSQFMSQKDNPVDYLFEIRLSDRLEPLPPRSISRGQVFYNLLAPLLSPAQRRARMDFDSLPIPLRIVATDILSGKRVVFSKGNMAAAVRASCGVPLAFSPVRCDSMLLMDGGLAANIPVDIAAEANPDRIIAVDVTSPLWKMDDLENPVRLVDQIISIGIRHQRETQKSKADLVLAPELEGCYNTDFSHVDSLIAIGYRCMRQQLDTLYALVGRPDTLKPALAWTDSAAWVDTGALRQVTWISTVPDVAFSAGSAIPSCGGGEIACLQTMLIRSGFDFATISRTSSDSSGVIAMADPGIIEGISISGNRKTSPGLIRTISGLDEGDVLSPAKVRRALSSIYATGLFDNVNVDLDTTGRVRVMVDEKKYWRVRMGLRYDEFNLGEGFVEPAYENLFGRGICARLHLQYGLRRERYVLDFLDNRPWSQNYANTARLQAYISSEQIYGDTVSVADSLGGTFDTSLWRNERSLLKSGVLGLLGFQVGNSAMLSTGVNLEFYKVHMNEMSVFTDVGGGIKFLPLALLRLTLDNMDKMPFPSNGTRAFMTMSGSSRTLGANENFLKFDGSARRVFTVFHRSTFSSQVRFVWSSSPLPEVEQSYLGGSFQEESNQDLEIYNYIPFMGLKPRAIFGDVAAVAHAGYSFTLRKGFYFTAAVDWGQAWKRGSQSLDQIADDFIKTAPVGVGAGIAVETILGPVRLSYGRLLHGYSPEGISADGHLYFSFGHDF